MKMFGFVKRVLAAPFKLYWTVTKFALNASCDVVNWLLTVQLGVAIFATWFIVSYLVYISSFMEEEYELLHGAKILF